MGIDIRDGQQMECISCALCIDACNTIMNKLGRKANLIAYDSVSIMNAHTEARPTKTRFIRPRTLTYSIILVLVAGTMAYELTTRTKLEINLQRDRSPLFVTLSDGGIRNGYTLKILNMAQRNRHFRLKVDNSQGTWITVIGFERDGAASVDLPVKAYTVGTFQVFVHAPTGILSAESTEMNFILTDLENGEETNQPTFFYGPKQ